MCVCNQKKIYIIHTHANVTTIKEKEIINFSEIKEKYMGRFQGRKEKKEMK